MEFVTKDGTSPGHDTRHVWYFWGDSSFMFNADEISFTATDSVSLDELKYVKERSGGIFAFIAWMMNEFLILSIEVILNILSARDQIEETAETALGYLASWKT